MSYNSSTPQLNQNSNELLQQQFIQLYLQHQLQIEAYVRSLILNRADADELLQDTAAVLWRKFEEFEQGTRFDHWACCVARHHMLNYFRQKGREILVFREAVDSAIAEEVIRQNDVWVDRKEALEQCLQQLSVSDRTLIIRRYQAAATNRSVAKETGRSETAISRALDRIYTALLNCIQRRLHEASGGNRHGR
jgi:RNA polymerase sigma-70 factor (ECF subfamily)